MKDSAGIGRAAKEVIEMATTREQRSKAIDVLQKEFDGATGIYLTDFTGINVEKISKFRRNLHSAGAKYIVVKNTLARIALQKCGREELAEHLKGVNGVAFTKDDAVGPARVIKDFKKIEDIEHS